MRMIKFNRTIRMNMHSFGGMSQNTLVETQSQNIRLDLMESFNSRNQKRFTEINRDRKFELKSMKYNDIQASLRDITEQHLNQGGLHIMNRFTHILNTSFAKCFNYMLAQK